MSSPPTSNRRAGSPGTVTTTRRPSRCTTGRCTRTTRDRAAARTPATSAYPAISSSVCCVGGIRRSSPRRAPASASAGYHQVASTASVVRASASCPSGTAATKKAVS